MSRVLTILLTACVVILTVLCGTAVAVSIGLLDQADLRRLGVGRTAMTSISQVSEGDARPTPAKVKNSGGLDAGNPRDASIDGHPRAPAASSHIKGTIGELEVEIRNQMRAYADALSLATGVDRGAQKPELKKAMDRTAP